MLSKAVSKIHQKAQLPKSLSLMRNLGMRSFSHGPYNPLQYKSYLVPEELPT